MAAVQSIFDRYKLLLPQLGPAFDTQTMLNATILDASLGPPYELPVPLSTTAVAHLPPPPNTSIVSTCTSKLFIGKEYGNFNGVLHGGAAGVIFDMLTTIALGPVARPGFWVFLGGVTRTLNISYLKAVPINTTVIVHAYCYQVGRTTAYIKGWMTSEDGATTYAVCDHHKIHTPPVEAHLQARVAWDELWDGEGRAKL
ncbi:unnamed protein product [Discula destructiva]